MTNQRTTKQAFVAAVVTLAMCFAMLLGTTFAWFTDSVTSSGNIIQSGTLDVGMYWADGTAAVPADNSGWTDASTGAIFNYTLWEPGFVQVRHLKIANEGTLSLKYKVVIVANGEISDLSDVIDVYYVDPAVQVADRTDLDENNRLGTLTEVLANLGTTGNGELTAGKVDTITIALKMQGEAGNDYQKKSIGSDFSIMLVATQLADESDSFNGNYDADAEYPLLPTKVSTTTDLSAALADGEWAVMEGNVTLTGPVLQSGGILDGNGNTLTYTDTGATIMYTAGGKIQNVTVQGGRYSNIIDADGITEDLYVEGVVVNGTNSGYVLVAIGDGTQSVYVKDSVLGGTIPVAAEGLKYISFDNCDFNGKSALYSLMSVNAPATYTNCDFSYIGFTGNEEDMNGAVITLDNCRYDGVLITADNFASFFNKTTGNNVKTFKNINNIVFAIGNDTVTVVNGAITITRGN